MDINLVCIYFTLVIIGLCMGSFAGATVWRLRAYQLKKDKADGEKVDRHEYGDLKKLTKNSLVNDRSQCLHCGYQLKWYDLLPLISWLSLKGKCRKCHKKIGSMEPLIELGMALFFVGSYAFWPTLLNTPLLLAHFIIWLVAGVILGILFVYDLKWSLLPDSVNFIFAGLGLLNTILVFIYSTDRISTAWSVFGALLIMSGLYLFVYLISKGQWIGFGDVKLGVGLALMLVIWEKAFIALFLANLIGCLIVLPAMLAGKLKRDSRIPFGPLLIIGFVITGLFGQQIIDMYLSFII